MANYWYYAFWFDLDISCSSNAWWCFWTVPVTQTLRGHKGVSGLHWTALNCTAAEKWEGQELQEDTWHKDGSRERKANFKDGKYCKSFSTIFYWENTSNTWMRGKSFRMLPVKRYEDCWRGELSDAAACKLMFSLGIWGEAMPSEFLYLQVSSAL